MHIVNIIIALFSSVEDTSSSAPVKDNHLQSKRNRTSDFGDQIWIATYFIIAFAYPYQSLLNNFFFYVNTAHDSKLLRVSGTMASPIGICCEVKGVRRRRRESGECARLFKPAPVQFSSYGFRMVVYHQSDTESILHSAMCQFQEFCLLGNEVMASEINCELNDLVNNIKNITYCYYEPSIKLDCDWLIF